MLRFLILGCFLAFAHGGVLPDIPPQLAMDWDRSGKIVGGEAAQIEDAPYQVALLRGSTLFQSCGGAILSESVVITAGHCASGSSASSWKIRAGSALSNSGGQVIDVARLLVHPLYNFINIDYDVALFYLQTPIKLDGIKTAPIPLPKQNQEIATGAKAFVTGWGATREGGSTTVILQKVTIPIVSQEDCKKAYGSSQITDRMICAGLLGTGGQDACQGDSGGPLAVEGALIGITSWGRGCARPDYPGVWTRVPAVVDWITQNA